MKEVFKRATTSIICSSIIAFLIGLTMVLLPNASLQTIGIIVGTYIIIHGMVLIAMEFKANMYYVPFDGIMHGVISILIGILLIAVPSVLSIAFTLVLGIWIVLSSINIIKMSMVIRDETADFVWLLLLGLLDLFIGIMILFNPFATLLSITVFAGIVIMAHSMINIVDMLVLKKDVKSLNNAIKNSIKEK